MSGYPRCCYRDRRGQCRADGTLRLFPYLKPQQVPNSRGATWASNLALAYCEKHWRKARA